VQASILGISNKTKLGSFRFEEVTLSESNHLEIAIAEDNVDKLRTLLHDQKLLESTFDQGMNILNLAIDQESVNVIEFIADTLTPQQTKALWTHKYAKDMSAVHQAASLGNLAILKTLT
jgi:hypothetical protein